MDSKKAPTTLFENSRLDF